MRALRVCVLVIALVVALSGCELMKRISEGAYRNAVADGAVDELSALGVPMDRRPDCVTLETGDDSVVRIRCTGRTATGARVEVTGGAVEADTARPRESYVITVDGREVLRKHCLGTGC